MRERTNRSLNVSASTCSTDFIDASNSQLSCTTQPVTIGQTCKVTCTFDQEKQFSVIYTCVGKNKWSPELPVLSCEGEFFVHWLITVNVSNLFINIGKVLLLLSLIMYYTRTIVSMQDIQFRLSLM